MKIVELTEATLSTADIGMGLYQMYNDEVTFFGGMRSGGSRAEVTRLKFMIYDMRGATEQLTQEEQEKRESGFVELFVYDGTQDVEGLVNIEIKPNMRRNGIGRIAIESLVDTFSPLRIYDIKQKAVPFWRKMGATFYADQHFKHVAKKTTGVKTGLYGII